MYDSLTHPAAHPTPYIPSTLPACLPCLTWVDINAQRMVQHTIPVEVRAVEVHAVEQRRQAQQLLPGLGHRLHQACQHLLPPSLREYSSGGCIARSIRPSGYRLFAAAVSMGRLGCSSSSSELLPFNRSSYYPHTHPCAPPPRRNAWPAFAIGGLGFEFCVFVVGWRHKNAVARIK